MGIMENSVDDTEAPACWGAIVEPSLIIVPYCGSAPSRLLRNFLLSNHVLNSHFLPEKSLPYTLQWRHATLAKDIQLSNRGSESETILLTFPPKHESLMDFSTSPILCPVGKQYRKQEYLIRVHLHDLKTKTLFNEFNFIYYATLTATLVCFS